MFELIEALGSQKLVGVVAGAGAPIHTGDSELVRTAASVRFRRIPDVARFGILACVDVATLFCAGALSYAFWASRVLHQPAALYTGALPLVVLFPLIYGVMGLYRVVGPGAVETIRRLSYGTSLGFLLLTATEFSFKVGPVYSRAAFAFAWLGALLLLPLFRFLALSVLTGFKWWGEPTLVIGGREQVEKIVRRLHGAKSLGYRIVGAFCFGLDRFSNEIASVRVFGAPEKIFMFHNSGATTVLVCSGLEGVTVEELQRRFRRVVMMADESGLPVEHAQVINFGHTLGIEFTNQLLRRENRVIKRALDIVCGTLFLIVASPLILVGGLLVKIVSRGPIFFRQEREGLDGRTITLWKIRTMRCDSERVLEDCLARDAKLRAEWSRRLKLSRDPRVVGAVGRLLRRFSIDELPQLLSVVRGDMSLVGPRPFPEYHLKMFTPEFRQFRNSVRPGLTGMWQVMIRSDGSIDEQQFYDSHYIRNWSLWLDVYILAKTVLAVLGAQGAC